jgi:putative phosphoesterase
MKLGIISDTHSHLNPQIHKLFCGVDAIIHAGDIGSDDILIELQTIAPVTTVRGNMDRHGTVSLSPEFTVTAFDGILFFIVHDLGTPIVIKKHLVPLLRKYAPQVVVFGHTHKPYARSIGDTFYFNPGSATSGRSGSSESVGLIETNYSPIQATILPLETVG